MIEKIPDQIPVQTGEWRGTTFDIIPKETFGMACRKINELIDTVNELQTKVNKMAQNLNFAQPEVKENTQDPYAEQRNYDVYVKNRHLIGKLCKFKCGQGCYYGILTNIKRKPHEIPFESNGRAFRTCEPVKPDEDIIYKGE